MAITLEYNIKVNDGAAVSSLGDIEKELSKINEELKTVDVNSEAFDDLSAKSKILKKDLDTVTKSIDGMTAEDKIKGFQGAIDIAGGSVAALTGAVGLLGIENEEFEKYTAYAANALAFSQGLKQMGDGAVSLAESLGKSAKAQSLFNKFTKLTSSSMGKFKVALAATGIGALVVGVGLLIANFDKVSAWVNKMLTKFPALGAVVDSIKDGFDRFIEAIRPALEWLGLMPDEAERAEEAAKQLASTLAKEAEKDLQRAQAAGASAEELYKLKKDLLDKQLQDLIANNAKQEEIEALKFQKELLDIAERARLKEEARKKAEEEIKATRKAEIEEFEAQAKKLEETLRTDTNVVMGLASAKDQLKASVKGIIPLMTEEHKQIKKGNDDLDRKAKKEAEVQKGVYASAAAITNLSSVLDQQSVAGKALAISTALINTYLGVTEALKQKSTLPSPFDVITKVANVATILATGLAAVKNIKSTPSTGGGTPRSIPVNGPRVADVSQPQIPLGFAPETQEQQPIKAYVVAGDVSSSQEANAKIQSKRTLG